MITLGDLLEKSRIVIFPENSTEKLYNNCKQRESELKRTISITLKALDVHVQEFKKNRSSIQKWKKDWMQSCMHKLGDYLDYLINELTEKKIKDYCKLESVLGERFIPFMPDLVLIMTNSYYGAVESDIHWISDLTLSDSFDISIGDFDFNKLTAYVPNRIIEIEQLFEELKCVQYVHTRIDSIKETIRCFQSNNERASNLLLITLIEGLVRALGIYLKEKQGLTIDLLDKRKYASLESFLKKISWSKDLQITQVEYGLLTGNHNLNKQTTEDYVLVDLSERLGFLCRRFKETRNTILHGEEANYASTLNTYLNFSALKEVLLTIKAYHRLYE